MPKIWRKFAFIEFNTSILTYYNSHAPKAFQRFMHINFD